MVIVYGLKNMSGHTITDHNLVFSYTVVPVFLNHIYFFRIRISNPELEFLKRLWGLGAEEEEGYRTGPPGYIGWRNSFLGIDTGAPYTFKNTGSEFGSVSYGHFCDHCKTRLSNR
jgi:hypothetical protein